MCRCASPGAARVRSTFRNAFRPAGIRRALSQPTYGAHYKKFYYQVRLLLMVADTRGPEYVTLFSPLKD